MKTQIFKSEDAENLMFEFIGTTIKGSNKMFDLYYSLVKDLALLIKTELCRWYIDINRLHSPIS